MASKVGRLLWPLGRPIPHAKPKVIIDLDETLLWRQGGWVERARLYLVPESIVGTPYPAVNQAITRSSKYFDFVAVTARNQLASRNTLHWLRQHGFENIPVIHSAAVFPGDSGRDDFKGAAIRSLCTSVGQPCVAGVGDRPSDLLAYTSTGLHAIMAIHSTPGLAQDVDAANSLRAFDKLRSTAARLPAAQAQGSTAASPAAGQLAAHRITYVTDVPAVFEAAASDESLSGRLHRPVIDDKPGSSTGPGPALPPVWEQVASILQDEADMLGLKGETSSSGGGEHWEEEATGSAYIANKPAQGFAPPKWRG